MDGSYYNHSVPLSFFDITYICAHSLSHLIIRISLLLFAVTKHYTFSSGLISERWKKLMHAWMHACTHSFAQSQWLTRTAWMCVPNSIRRVWLYKSRCNNIIVTIMEAKIIIGEKWKATGTRVVSECTALWKQLAFSFTFLLSQRGSPAAPFTTLLTRALSLFLLLLFY